jgi:Zn-dependent M28 family amino/carboxypeptidase
MVGMFLLGLWLAKRGVLARPERHLSLIRTATWAGLGMGLLFSELYVEAVAAPADALGAFGRLAQVGTRTVGAVAFVVFYTGIVLLMMRQERWRRSLSPLGAVGRTSLSNYLMQSVVFTTVFYGYGLGLYGQVGSLFNVGVAVLFYGLQVRLSEWWLERHRYGPAEWVWRVLAYGRWLPLRRGPGATFWSRVRRRLKQADRRMVYGVVVLLLLGGLAALIWRAGSQGVAVVLDPSEIRARPQETPAPVSAATARVETAVATPAVQPVAYEPESVAALGDLYALASAFDAQAALAEVETLTSAPYLGRYPGSFGGQAAGEHIAARFAEYGLQPAGPEGSYFQRFPIEYVSLQGVPSLVVDGPGGSWRRGYRSYEHFSPIARQYAGEGVASGRVMWADDCSRQDLSSVPVVGKVVLCRDGAVLEAGRHALEYGAAGLLLLADPANRPPDFGTTYGEAWVPEPLPVFRVYPSLVADLLAGSEITLAELSTAFAPLPLETTVHMALDTGGAEGCAATGCVGRNVLGVIPGRDPGHASEVIILGAHYDHLGESPDGTTWVGANDNASGVAVLLEIARTWHEQGYVPRRTVLFAAWDAEEMGLIGSRYFVSHPQYPLQEIVAMVQLDMVGAGGEVLRIDGSQGLGERLAAAADAVDVETSFSQEGRSDHVPFWEAGIPASLLIWSVEEGAAPTYHRPVDRADTLDEAKLEAVGLVTGIGVLGLTDGELAIADLLAAREAAFEVGDLEAFLDTSAPGQWEGDRHWYADLLAVEPLEVEMAARDVRVRGRSASAMVQIEARYRESNAEQESVLRGGMPTRFTYKEGGWFWAGPDLERAAGDGGQAFTVLHPPGQTDGTVGLAQRAAERYQRVTSLMGLPALSDAVLQLMPSLEALRVATAMSQPFSPSGWVSSGTIRLQYSPSISSSTQLDDALVQLSLAEAGVNKGAAPWLWEGLPIAVRSVLRGDAGIELWQVQASLGEEGAAEDVAASWAAVETLRQEIGWEGIGRLVLDLGQACRIEGCGGGEALDKVLLEQLQMDRQAFAAFWRASWRDRLGAMQAGVDAALAARSEAVLVGDKDAFLRTVYEGVPYLVVEEGLWFDDAMRYPPQSYGLTAQLVKAEEDGTLVAEVTVRYRGSEDGVPEGVVTLLTRFVPVGDGYRWAGARFEAMEGQGVRVLYPSGRAEIAAAYLRQIEETGAQVAEALGVVPPNPLLVKLYDDADAFRCSIGPVTGGSRGLVAWTDRGASIKFLLGRSETEQEIHPSANVQIARHMLREMGVSAAWLIEGASVYLTEQIDGSEIGRQLAGGLESIQLEARNGRVHDLAAMSLGGKEGQESLDLAQVYAWDAIRYLVHTYGHDSLLSLLKAQARGDLGVAVEAVLGQTLGRFEQEWTVSLARGHARPEWVDIAAAFDVDQASAHIGYLAGDALAGRQPGSAGAALAAEYVARSFAELGLAPIWTGEGGDGYVQRFPISYTALSETPILELVDDEGRMLRALSYRADFVMPQLVSLGGGDVEGELVWINDATYEGLRLDGKIVLRTPSLSLEQEAAVARDHGAAGLIVVGKIGGQKRPWAKHALPVAAPVSGTLPVLELTRAGFDWVLEEAGYRDADFHGGPRALPLGTRARMSIRLDALEQREAVNVLGLLPGSDPQIADEVILLSAHYDHVGDDPEGWACPPGVSAWDERRNSLCTPVPASRYPGANDNASGVAVMLEIARLWQAAGYRPSRSVLFAAWGAQDSGQRGMVYYAEHPALPFEEIYGALHLEAVGGGEGYYLGAQGTRGNDGLLRAALQAAEDEMDGRLTIASPPKRDDPAALLRQAEIPTLWLTWRDASEENWPAQYADPVEPYRLGVTGQMVSLGLMILAR